MTKNQQGLMIVGAVAVGLLIYLAQQQTPDNLSGVPAVESEEQFGGMSADIGQRHNAGTPLDIDPVQHFFSPGYSCPGQNMVLTQHRYPLVSGGNISTLIHRGFDAFRLGSPDNSWRVQPPSEYNL